MFIVSDSHQLKWDSSKGRYQPISLVPIDRGSLSEKKIFAMGSCFAREMRVSLTELGFDIFPKYFDITFNSSVASIGRLPEFDNVNHYSIQSIVQEFLNLESQIYLKDYFYDLSGNDNATRRIRRFVRSILSPNKKSIKANWQDPFRKHVYAESVNELGVVSEKITEKIREGAEAADVLIFTLGMSEVWLDKNSKLAICNSYGGDVDQHLCEFVDYSYSDIKEKTGKLVKLVRKINPDADIVFSVSPVPLQRTYNNKSIVVANSLSKAKQRVAVEEICSEFENVYYFPSYELSMDEDFFKDDGRHVKLAKIKHIINSFLGWYQGLHSPVLK